MGTAARLRTLVSRFVNFAYRCDPNQNKALYPEIRQMNAEPAWFLVSAGLEAAHWAWTVVGSIWPPQPRLTAYTDAFSRHPDAIPPVGWARNACHANALRG